MINILGIINLKKQNLLIGSIFAVVFCFLVLLIVIKKEKQPIFIRHRLDAKYWIVLHIIVYYLSMPLMILMDLMSFKFNRIPSVAMNFKGIVILFIRSGGMIIFIMLISSWVYNKYIKIGEFQYFIKRHRWLKKLFFSMVCFSLASIYYLILRMESENINILSEEYNNIIVWLIVMIQIWIGFGMDFYEKEEKKLRFKQFLNQKKDKEERKLLFICILSIVFVPGFTVMFVCFAEQIPEYLQEVIDFIYYCVLSSTILTLLLLGVWLKRQNLSEKASSRVLHKSIKNPTNIICIKYYRKLKYMLVKTGMSLELTIYHTDVELDVEEGAFSEKFRKSIERFCVDKTYSFSLEKYCLEEITSMVERKLKCNSIFREKKIKKAWDIVYKFCTEKERAKAEKMLSTE